MSTHQNDFYTYILYSYMMTIMENLQRKELCRHSQVWPFVEDTVRSWPVPHGMSWSTFEHEASTIHTHHPWVSVVLFVWNYITDWWFGTFFIFPYIGNSNPNWLIFLKGVETTNQQMSGISIWLFLEQPGNLGRLWSLWRLVRPHFHSDPPNKPNICILYIYMYISD